MNKRLQPNSPIYEPTPEEIELECAKIRATWPACRFLQASDGFDVSHVCRQTPQLDITEVRDYNRNATGKDWKPDDEELT